MRHLYYFIALTFLLAPSWAMAAPVEAVIGKTFVLEEDEQVESEEESYACTSAKYNLADARSYLNTVKTDTARDYAEGLVKRAVENVQRDCS
jgi:hypothetical protein